MKRINNKGRTIVLAALIVLSVALLVVGILYWKASVNHNKEAGSVLPFSNDDNGPVAPRDSKIEEPSDKNDVSANIPSTEPTASYEPVTILEDEGEVEIIIPDDMGGEGF
jgi:hypothetical protein